MPSLLPLGIRALRLWRIPVSTSSSDSEEMTLQRNDHSIRNELRLGNAGLAKVQGLCCSEFLPLLRFLPQQGALTLVHSARCPPRRSLPMVFLRRAESGWNIEDPYQEETKEKWNIRNMKPGQFTKWNAHLPPDSKRPTQRSFGCKEQKAILGHTGKGGFMARRAFTGLANHWPSPFSFSPCNPFYLDFSCLSPLFSSQQPCIPCQALRFCSSITLPCSGWVPISDPGQGNSLNHCGNCPLPRSFTSVQERLTAHRPVSIPTTVVLDGPWSSTESEWLSDFPKNTQLNT